MCQCHDGSHSCDERQSSSEKNSSNERSSSNEPQSSNEPHSSNERSSSNEPQSSNGRRGFIKKLSTAGLITGGLLSSQLSSGFPKIASAFEENDLPEDKWLRSETLRSGKAEHITILHTADIHGQLFTHDEFFWENGNPVYKRRGGMAVLKTMLNQLRNQNPGKTLLLDGGDCFQGSGIASMTQGKAIVPLINNIGYDLMLPGNWEVVYGKEMLMKDMGAYAANKVCANMFHDDEARKGEMMFPPYWIKHFGTVKIGFIGYNDPMTPRRQPPAYSAGVKFTQPDLNVSKYIKYLREYEMCSMIFLVTHMGIAQQVDLGNNPVVEGVDFILGADTHERVRKPIEAKYAKVTEPGAFGSFVSKLDLIIEDGKLKDAKYQLLDVDPEKYKPDAEMQTMVNEAKKPFQKELDTVIGVTKNTLVRYYVLENPMDNLITDAIQWKFKPDIALSNGFRFCPPLVVDPKKGKADITNEFLWNMLPVDSDAKAGEITGEQLWNWLEKELHNVFAKKASERFGGWVVRFSGMEINITARNEKGKRLNWVRIKGEMLDKNKTYSIVACERDGDPNDTLCRIEHVSNPHRLDITLHQIIKEYLSVHSPVSPKVEGRVTATDVPQTLFTQLEGYDYEFR